MANTNGYQGQLRAFDQPNGYFTTNQNIMLLIQNDCNNQYHGSIQRVSIDTDPDTNIELNGKNIKIGKTGFYEINNVQITSFKFLQNSSKSTVIDYII